MPATEVPYDGVDQDCDGSDLTDVDNDGWASGEDCDDANNDIYPGASEVPYDGVDQDCNGSDLDDLDDDGFDFATDCNDLDPEVHPGHAETCDGVDQDCDLLVDEHSEDALTGFWDADGDGYGDPDSTWTSCESLGPNTAGDCDDHDSAVNPGSQEECSNGVDDNCDGLIDLMAAGGTHATIQGAIEAACEDGDVVQVLPGTYYENINILRPVQLLGIEGPESTTIDGSSCSGPDCPVIVVSAQEVVLSGLSISGGYRASDDGGGVDARTAEDTTISDCQVSGNHAYNGGGIAIGGGEISGTTFKNNSATSYGGGLYIPPAGGPVLVAQSKIGGNSAAYGGGAYQYAHLEVVWRGNTITDNTAWMGGGLFLHGDQPSTTANTISSNRATATAWGLDCIGGGVWDEWNDWSSSGDTISGNSPEDTCN